MTRRNSVYRSLFQVSPDGLPRLLVLGAGATSSLVALITLYIRPWEGRGICRQRARDLVQRLMFLIGGEAPSLLLTDIGGRNGSSPTMLELSAMKRACAELGVSDADCGVDLWDLPEGMSVCSLPHQVGGHKKSTFNPGMLLLEVRSRPVEAQEAGNRGGASGPRNGFTTSPLHARRYVLKPYQGGGRGEQELQFYEGVFGVDDGQDIIRSHLVGFLCPYFGMIRVAHASSPTPPNPKPSPANDDHQSEESRQQGGGAGHGGGKGGRRPGVLFIVLGDVCEGMTAPCGLDVKMGRVTYQPNAPEEKKLRADQKYPDQSIAGFRIVGMRWVGKPPEAEGPEAKGPEARGPEVKGGENEDRVGEGRQYLNLGKEWGRSLRAEDTGIAFVRFFHDGQRLRQKRIICALRKLKAMLAWFRHQDTYLFYSTSILMMYDADAAATPSLKPNTPNPSGGESNGEGEGEEEEEEEEVEVRMIDFAHAIPMAPLREARGKEGSGPGGLWRDEGYRYGLTQLVKTLEEILEVGWCSPCLSPPSALSSLLTHMGELKARSRTLPIMDLPMVDLPVVDPHSQQRQPSPTWTEEVMTPVSGESSWVSMSHSGIGVPRGNNGEDPMVATKSLWHGTRMPRGEAKIVESWHGEGDTGRGWGERQGGHGQGGESAQSARAGRVLKGKMEMDRERGLAEGENQGGDSAVCGDFESLKETLLSPGHGGRMGINADDCMGEITKLVNRLCYTELPPEEEGIGVDVDAAKGTSGAADGLVLGRSQVGAQTVEEEALWAVMGVLRASLEALETTDRELMYYRTKEEGDHSTSTIGALEATVSSFRAQVLPMTVRNMEWVASRIPKVQHSPEHTAKVFKQAHLAVKSVVVELGGDGRFGVKERWRLTEKKLASMKPHHATAVLENLRLLVVAFDNMAIKEMACVNTVAEIITNRDWLLRLARVCSVAEARARHISASQTRHPMVMTMKLTNINSHKDSVNGLALSSTWGGERLTGGASSAPATPSRTSRSGSFSSKLAGKASEPLTRRQSAMPGEGGGWHPKVPGSRNSLKKNRRHVSTGSITSGSLQTPVTITHTNTQPLQETLQEDGKIVELSISTPAPGSPTAEPMTKQRERAAGAGISPSNSFPDFRQPSEWSLQAPADDEGCQGPTPRPNSAPAGESFALGTGSSPSRGRGALSLSPRPASMITGKGLDKAGSIAGARPGDAGWSAVSSVKDYATPSPGGHCSRLQLEAKQRGQGSRRPGSWGGKSSRGSSIRAGTAEDGVSGGSNSTRSASRQGEDYQGLDVQELVEPLAGNATMGM